MIRFSGCSPAVISSNLVNPVGTPVTSLPLAVRDPRCSSSTSLIMSPIERVGLAAVLLGDLEDRGLGLVEELLVTRRTRRRRVDWTSAHGGDQPAQGRLLAARGGRSAAMFSAVGTALASVVQVGLAALEAGEQPRVFSSSADGDDVDRLPAPVERQHRLEDLAVGGQEEVVDAQAGRDLVERRRLDQHSTRAPTSRRPGCAAALAPDRSRRANSLRPATSLARDIARIIRTASDASRQIRFTTRAWRSVA